MGWKHTRIISTDAALACTSQEFCIILEMAKTKGKTQFQRGHVPYYRRQRHGSPATGMAEEKSEKKWQRIPKNIFADVVHQTEDGRITTHDVHGQPTDTHFLRPGPREQTVLEKLQEAVHSDPDLQSYRVFHMQKIQELYKEAMTDHFPPLPCGGHLIWDMNGEQKWGFSWRERLKCSKCDYKSRTHHLYETVETHKRGPKASTLNVGLAVGLSQSSIAGTGLREIMGAANVGAPSPAGLQKTANIVGEKIKNMNIEDMRMQRKHVKDVQEMRGDKRGAGIRAEADGRYNNRLSSGFGKSPFQPATQMVVTIIENTTPSKKIIAINAENKLCHTCATHPGRRHKCTKTIPLDQTIGDEGKFASRAYGNMQGEKGDEGNLDIRYLTTDRDGHAARGIAESQDAPLENLYDTVHLGKAVINAVKKSNFSRQMLQHTTKKERDLLQKEFGHDVKRRTHAEFEKAYERHRGDLTSLKICACNIMDAMISCYSGECRRLCYKYSLVCKGTKSRKWSHNYLMFAKPKNKPLDMTDMDMHMLKQCIVIRLGPKAVESQMFNTNTQKSESTNLTYSKTNPRRGVFKRNFVGRIHSAAHIRNHGLGESTALKCEAVGAPIPPGSKVARDLKRMQDQNRQRLLHAQSEKSQVRRFKARQDKCASYSEKQERIMYQKDVLKNEQRIMSQRKKIVHSEHQYSLGASKNPHNEHSYSK